jgi:hypothetical protein
MSVSNKKAKAKNNKLMDLMMKVYKVKTKNNLPKAQYSRIIKQECNIEMSDGIKLAAMVQKPNEEGAWPVIIIRNPYVAAEGMYANLILPIFAQQGYVAIHVRVRGSITSEGDWLPFENERKDGREVVDWVARQKWCNGNIGTYGSSYCGHTQWSIADYEHPALKTMFISVFGAKPYNLFYRRGMFRQDIWTDWAATMMGDNRFKATFSKQFKKKIFEVKSQKYLGKEINGEDYDWYDKWICNTKQTDMYWSEGFWKEFENCIEKIKIPLFLHGGWYDIFLRSEIETFRQLPENIRKKSRFVIGPWGHGGSAVGNALEFPGEDTLGFLQIKGALEWFNFHLKGMDYHQAVGVVETYNIGENRWQVWENDIKPHTKINYYLNTDEKENGKLCSNQPDFSKTVRYEYDPKYPTPSCGGTLLSSVRRGTKDNCCLFQPKVGEKPGVVSFLSEPMDNNLHMAGAIKAHIFVSSSVSATAFSITVMEMFSDGQSVNIRDDITDIRWRDENRIENYVPESIVELEIIMLDCAWMIKKGSRLRIDITSSNYPAYHVHPNNEENWYETIKTSTAIQTLYCGGEYPSRIELPISNDIDV